MKPIKTLWRGIDTLKMGISATWDPAAHSELTRTLQRLQDNARDPAATPETLEIFADQPTQGLPTGRRKYKHGLSTDGLRIFFEQRPEPDDDTPNLWIEAGPTKAATGGPASVLYQATQIIEALGGQINWHRISEIHCTTDIQTETEMHPDHYYQDGKPCFVTKSKYEQQMLAPTTIITKCHTLEYFRRGSDQLLVRIYDKTRHIKAQPTYAWESTLWDCTAPPDHVIRVEFQIRREKLKALRINTVEDWKNSENGVWSYLTEDWFTLHETPGRKQRRSPSPFWQQVIDSRPSSNPIKPRPSFNRHVEQRASQVIGNLASAIALRSVEKTIDNETQAWEEIKSIYEESHPEKLDIMQQIRDRLQKFRTIHGDAVIFGEDGETRAPMCNVRGDVIDDPPARPAGKADAYARPGGRAEPQKIQNQKNVRKEK